jgi:hypothetical protein
MNQTKETLHKRNTPFTWFILLGAFFFFVPSLSMDSIWINLRSVEVKQPINSNGVIELVVDRTIHREFRGVYSVDIKRINGINNEAVCRGKPVTPFFYNPSNELPDPVSLTWWLGGEKNMVECKENGFQEGTLFQVLTCHTVVVSQWDIPLARRCVLSNTFSLEKE